ncbi:hypothetical protein FISHEDRAFT_78278 [Fistulina hepatica ATCC 64428]|nr:hypothetical protein FISHEDRAFT_78278 [Fistulina hepatica ATCC 64428]
MSKPFIFSATPSLASAKKRWSPRRGLSKARLWLKTIPRVARSRRSSFSSQSTYSRPENVEATTSSETSSTVEIEDLSSTRDNVPLTDTTFTSSYESTGLKDVFEDMKVQSNGDSTDRESLPSFEQLILVESGSSPLKRKSSMEEPDDDCLEPGTDSDDDTRATKRMRLSPPADPGYDADTEASIDDELPFDYARPPISRRGKSSSSTSRMLATDALRTARISDQEQDTMNCAMDHVLRAYGIEQDIIATSPGQSSDSLRHSFRQFLGLE